MQNERVNRRKLSDNAKEVMQEDHYRDGDKEKENVRMTFNYGALTICQVGEKFFDNKEIQNSLIYTNQNPMPD